MLNRLIFLGCIAVLGPLNVAPSLADDLTVESGQTLTTTQDIGSGSAVIIEDGGKITIEPVNPGVEAVIGTDDNSIMNYGTISSLDSGDGIQLGNRNAIVNYGVLETSARSPDLSSEDVVEFDGALESENSLINFGTIRVFDSINGYGVYIAEGTKNIIQNYGLIETTGQGSNAIHVETTDNTIINHGTILTRGLTGDGIYIVGGSTFINSGTLISLNDQAIHMHGEDNEVYLLAGSAVYGRLTLHNSSNQLFDIGNGLNAMLTFENFLPATINMNGMPGVTDEVTLQLAVVDPTGFAMAEDLLADIADQAFGAVSSRLKSVRRARGVLPDVAITPVADVLAPISQNAGMGIWAAPIGTWRQQAASGISWSAEQTLEGLTGGADIAWSHDMHAGAFAGAAKAELEVDDDAQAIAAENRWAGVYASRDAGRFQFDLAGLVGWQTNESTRRMVDNTVAGGVAHAEATYDALFASSEVAASLDLDMLGRRLSSTLALRYAGLFIEAYEEDGSNADLTVEARDAHSITARAELSHLFELSSITDGMHIEALGGAEARYSFGDEVSAELLSQDISFDPDGETTTISGFIGGELVYTAMAGSLVFGIGGKAALATDESRTVGLHLRTELFF